MKESLSTDEHGVRWFPPEARAEKIALAIEQSIVAAIACMVHMNHKFDTWDNAHKKLVEEISANLF